MVIKQFSHKNVTEKERGLGVKIPMLFNTLYGRHQQLPQPNIEV
jgi:hypothetical protein